MINIYSLVAIFASTTAGATTLCNIDESTYFSCKLDNDETISICAYENTSPSNGYVQWRMSNGEPTLSTLPSEFIAPKGVIQVNRYSEKIYSFTSFTLTNNETLYSAYMGDYGEDHWMEGITIGDKQISCKTAVQSDYRTGLFSTSLEEANTPLSKYPFDEIVEAALQTQLPE